MPDPATYTFVLEGDFISSEPTGTHRYRYAVFCELPSSGETISTILTNTPVDLTGTWLPQP